MDNQNLPILAGQNAEGLHLGPELGSMPDVQGQPESSGMGLHDILFMLFRHKGKILALTLIGLIAAIGVYLLTPPVYESEAKLLVRYVMERSAVDGLDSQIKTPTPENHTLINSEVEILTSSDLIRQVAETVGVERFVSGPPSEANANSAVDSILKSLEVSVIKDTNIISVAFESNNPKLPMPVVQELVKRYFDKHLAVHRSTGAFEFVRQETATLKKQLVETEAELQKLKDSSGILSITEAKADIAAETGRTQQELDSVVADVAAQKARVNDLEKSLSLPATQINETPAQPVSGDILEQYKSLVARLTDLQRVENELLLKYTAQNPLVKLKTTQIADLEKQRSDLEKQYPALLGTAAAVLVAGQAGQPNITGERAILAGLESKLVALNSRVESLQQRARVISAAAPRFEELE